ncbi:MAG: response regulator transcription factor [Capsulimonadaceae bacterium]|nr:response regulator transcription factor [Capsulimonadaceae bacterium]
MDQPTNPLRILIADDHPVVRTGIKSFVHHRQDMTVVAEACNGREAVSLYEKHSPDVTLLDLRMPEMDGIEALVAIRAMDSTARVIVLTSYDGDEDVYRALRSGAQGYVLKDGVVDDLVEAITTVASGKKFLKANVLSKLADRVAGPELTLREQEVLQQIAAGKTNQAIADILGISEGTVKAHIKNIFAKLQASDRTHAVTIAVRRSIVRLD